MQKVFSDYINYFENLTVDSVDGLRQLAVSDIHFVDPFNDVHGVGAVIEIFQSMFTRLREAEFIVKSFSSSEDTLYVIWEFSYSFWAIDFGRPQRFSGVSVVTANEESKIVEHIDYWDASTHVYMKIPVFGWIVRFIRHLIA